MKKLLSVLLAAMLVMSLCVTSFAAPTIDYVFKSATDYYLFGSTDKVVDDLGVEIASANVKAQTITFSEDGTPELLNTLNDVKKFGFKIGNPEDVIGNTIVFTPFEEVDGVKTNGLTYFAKNKVAESAVNVYDTQSFKSMDYTGKYVTISGNKVYSTKITSFMEKNGAFSGSANQPYIQLTCWDASTSSNKNDRRNAMIQFPLTEEMLDAESISLSIGIQYSLDNNMWKAFYENDYTLGLYEITGLSNNWDIGAATDITGLTRTPITTFEETATLDENGNRVDGNIKYVEAPIQPSSGVQDIGRGVVLTHTDEAFTSYIKNKIRNGEKVINISIEGIGAKDRVTGETLTSGGFFSIIGELNYSGSTLRPWREPFAPALIWE